MSEYLNTVTAGLLWVSSLVFIIYFAREHHWTKTAMGLSLMTMAVGILILSSHGVAFQTLGPAYWGRDWFVPVGRLVVVVAFAQRIWVLHHARETDPEV